MTQFWLIKLKERYKLEDVQFFHCVFIFIFRHLICVIRLLNFHTHIQLRGNNIGDLLMVDCLSW